MYSFNFWPFCFYGRFHFTYIKMRMINICKLLSSFRFYSYQSLNFLYFVVKVFQKIKKVVCDTRQGVLLKYIFYLHNDISKSDVSYLMKNISKDYIISNFTKIDVWRVACMCLILLITVQYWYHFWRVHFCIAEHFFLKELKFFKGSLFRKWKIPNFKLCYRLSAWNAGLL